MSQSITLDADAPIPVASIKALMPACVGVLRYAKAGGLNQAELADYHAAGLDVGLVFELGANDWQGGVAKGMSNGTYAVSYMRTLKWPLDAAIYCTFDSSIVPGDPAALQYLKGFETVVHPWPVGVYAEIPFLREVANHYLWSFGSWNGGGPNPALLQQQSLPVDIGGTLCDISDLYTSNWGQFKAPVKGVKKVDDQFISKNPKGDGDYLCSWSTRIAVGIPSLAVEAELTSQGAKRFDLTLAAFAYFTPKNWS
jgi:hypothetical protein